MTDKDRGERGLTLIELLVVVAIVAILGSVAIVSFGRQDTDRRFQEAAQKLAQEVYAARMTAASARDDRVLLFPAGGTKYLVHTALAGASQLALEKTYELPTDITIAGVDLKTDIPGDATEDAPVLPAVVRFSGTSPVRASKGSSDGYPPNENPATIYLKSGTGGYKGKIVIYRTTGYARYYDGW
jgi:prepilin-type N-terminal cleavage/methylation domain-containing protein